MYIDISISFDLIMLFSYSLTSLCTFLWRIVIELALDAGDRGSIPTTFFSFDQKRIGRKNK